MFDRADNSMLPTLCLPLVRIVCQLAIACVAMVPTCQAEPISFNRQIRPILSENCFPCHGPDETSREADLRLDEREQAIDYGALVPGEPNDSLIVQRISSLDPDIQMPPPEAHKKLTDEQKQMLVDWIAQGGAYQRHWSFEPIVAGSGKDQSIDGFIDARLAEQQLRAEPPAPRQRWLRRVTLDLTGLPPTVAEVDALLADQQPGAYERVIDRLLASQAYGERMAAEWLDVARYSDTYGYQVDRDRFVWPWRDWVVRAFNDNMPYDTFITQQLAGDLLPHASEDQILATTFNRLHPQKVEGGSVEEEFRVEYVVDRAQTVSTALMGLTFECARCHDHKFDPLTQQEFYELNAYFANINEAGLYSYHTRSVPTPTLTLPDDKQRKALARADEQVVDAEQQLQQAVARLAGAGDFAAMAHDRAPSGPVASQGFDGPEALQLPVKSVEGVAGTAALLSGDHGVPVGPARFARWQPFSVGLWMQTPAVIDRAVVYHRSAGWTDAASRGYQLLIENGKLSAALVHFWPGNAIGVRTVEQLPVSEWQHVVVTYDGSSRAAGLKIFANGELAETEIVADNLTKEIIAGSGTDIEIGRRERDRGFKLGQVDSFEVYDRQLTAVEIRARHKHQALEDLLLAGSLAQMTADEAIELLGQHVDEACRSARDKLTAAREVRDTVRDQIQEIMVMRELPQPRATYVLHRGLYDQRRAQVAPGTPAALPPLPDGAPNNRWGLAQWLTSAEHPLTARVAVNRYWQMLFGRGIVATTEDFGSQGSAPSHPELLDLLARRFIDSGWDVKQLIKTIATTRAYQRDSTNRGGSLEKDAANLWLARGPTTPLTAEMIRDSALAASGLLSRRIGGKPARPYELAVSFKPVERDQGEGLYRRSLYTYWKRTAPAPVMLVLDASTRDVCRVRRERTSSPLQAMVLLNGPQYVEAARGAAVEVLAELGQRGRVDQRLSRLFLRFTSRRPVEGELNVLRRLYDAQRQAFAQDEAAVESYLDIGELRIPIEADKVELAALAMVAQAVMNLDDCLIKR